MRAVSYRRVSTAEQGNSGLGLESQQAQIEDYINRHGWDLVEDFQDQQSGKSMTRRPGLDAALTMLESGQADALVVAKLDRLSRSLLDFTRAPPAVPEEGLEAGGPRLGHGHLHPGG